jgi:hypothetical protein
MRRITFCIILMVAAQLAPRTTAATCTTCTGADYGATLVTFDGVPFHSNGDCTAKGSGCNQCVEAVKRFYDDAGGFSGVAHHTITRSWGTADSAFSINDDYLTTYANGVSGVRPQPGDILCFCFGSRTTQDKPTYTNVGHVAIISKVVTDANGNGHVFIVDQNRTRYASAENLPLLLTYSGGHYTVGSFSSPHYATQGWMRNPNYTPPGSDASPAPDALPVPPPTTYLASVSTQDPYVIDLVPGQTATFSVNYINSGTGVWKGGSTSTSDSAYIELRSCNSSGTAQSSWLYNSGTGAWLSNSHVTTCDASSVAQLGTATFTFAVQVPLTQALGTYQQYFRLNRHIGGDLLTPGGYYDGYYVTVNVVAPQYTPIVGKFNTDGLGDVGLYESVSGTWRVALQSSGGFVPQSSAWLTNWPPDGPGAQILTGDFSGDGYTDLCAYYQSTGRWYVAYNQSGSNSGFVPNAGPGPNGSWLDGWAVGSDYIPFAGDFSGDGYYDIGVYSPSLGRWFVAYNNSGSNSGFVPNAGPGTYGCWLDSWAVGSDWVPFAKDFSGDGVNDIGVWSQSLGRWFVADNNSGSNSGFVPNTGPGTNGCWLDNWAVQSSQYNWRIYAAACHGGSLGDVVAYSPVLGRWFVAANGGGHFSQQNGPGTNGCWLDSWAIESGGTTWQTFVGDVSGDGYADLVAYTPQSGRWFVAYNWGGYFSNASGPSTYGSWLDNWGTNDQVLSFRAHQTPPGDDPPPQPGTLSFRMWMAPNPAVSSATINFTLPVADRVSISIYDVGGREVGTMPQRAFEAGQHSFVWNRTNPNGQHVQNGIYFVKFVSHLHTATTKVVVID